MENFVNFVRMTSHFYEIIQIIQTFPNISKHLQTTNQAFYLTSEFFQIRPVVQSPSRQSPWLSREFRLMFRAIRRHRGLDPRLPGYLKKNMKKIQGPSENCENLGKSSNFESGRRKILDIHLIKSCSTLGQNSGNLVENSSRIALVFWTFIP